MRQASFGVSDKLKKASEFGDLGDDESDGGVQGIPAGDVGGAGVQGRCERWTKSICAQEGL